jgi:Bacterial extracellular solute-binding protein, family 7
MNAWIFRRSDFSVIASVAKQSPFRYALRWRLPRRFAPRNDRQSAFTLSYTEGHMVSVSSTAAPRRPHCHGDRHAATQAIPRRWNRPRRRSGHSGDPTSEGRIGTDAAHRIYFAVGFAGQFPNAAPGADVELLKGVQLGSIDLACSTGLGLTSVLPEASELNIPFLFNSIAHAHAVLDGPMGESFVNSSPQRTLSCWTGPKVDCVI